MNVEATKDTEVGFVGMVVEGMIRDLAECAYRLVKTEKEEEVKSKATAAAEKRILRILAEVKKEDRGETPKELFEANLLDGLRKGAYDNLVVEMDVPSASGISSAIFSRKRRKSANSPSAKRCRSRSKRKRPSSWTRTP